MNKKFPTARKVRQYEDFYKAKRFIKKVLLASFWLIVGWMGGMIYAFLRVAP